MSRPVRHRLALVGPTAAGKSAVALAAARQLGDVELLAGDSMSVYVGMDIGTAKASAADRAEVAHHLVDLVEPAEEFTLARFQAAARAAVADAEAAGHRPLLVGGTGLYVQAVVDDLEIPGRWPQVRQALEAEPDTSALHARLASLDPVAAGRMEPTNRRRVVRALEVTLGSGRPFSSFGPGIDAYPASSFDLVGLRLEPAVLAARIEARVDAQLAAGFLDEVRRLAAGAEDAAGAEGTIPPEGSCALGGLSRTAAKALGYRELLAHLQGEISLAEARASILTRTRRLARRQVAWFRRDPRITWIDVADPLDALAELCERWRSDRPGA